MKQNVSKSSCSKLISLFFALLFSLILLAAVVGKIFYPPGPLKNFFQGVGFFECAFAVFLLVFYKQRWTWYVAALIFAAWGGYALFWALWGLPCGCFGKMLEMPAGVSLAIDIISFGVGVYLARQLGLKRRQIRFLLLFSGFSLIFGFLVAYILNHIVFY